MSEQGQIWDGAEFRGAKAAFVFDGSLVVLRRDDLPGLPWANMIDLPGGARDGDESPKATVRREAFEEVGLVIAEERLIRGRSRINEKGMNVWFFLCQITRHESQSLRLGDEGQACWMMRIEDYLSAPDAIPPLQASVRDVLEKPG